MVKKRTSGSLMYGADRRRWWPTHADRQSAPDEFYCEFCRTQQPGGTPDIWTCPFGCDASQPKCKKCFTPRLNRPRIEAAKILIEWHVKHEQNCHEPILWRAHAAPQGVYEDFAPKSLVSLAASLAAEVQPLGLLRRLVEGERVPAAELVNRATKLACSVQTLGPLAASTTVYADQAALAALWTAMIATVKDGNWPQRLAQYAWATKQLALRAGLNSVQAAELEVRSQLKSWAKRRDIRDEVVDAATAAWVVGERKFARTLVKRKGKSR